VGGEGFDADGEDAEAIFDALGAVVGEAGDVAGTFDEGSDEVLVVGGEFFYALIQDPINAFGEAGEADGVVGAGLVFVGEEVGLAVVFGDGAGAAFA